MRELLFCLAIGLSVQAAALTITFFEPVPETCGNSNGQVYTIVSGGTPPYSFSWSNGATTSDLINIPSGTYTLTVTDALGTVASESIFVPGLSTLPYTEGGSYLWEPGLPGAQVWGGACEGQCNGRIAMPLAVFGGTPPYTITWNASSTIVLEDLPTAQGLPIYANFCLDDEVTYTYTDATGCSGNGSFTVIGVDDDDVPSILAVQGACEGGANGRVDILCPQSPYVSATLQIYRDGIPVAWPQYPLWPQSTVQVPGLIPGDYELRVNWEGACPAVIPFTIPALSVDCGTVSGVNFLDDDQDCAPDAGEVRIPYQVLNIQPIDEWVLTGPDGGFVFALPNGGYTLDHASPGTVPLCPLPQPVPFTVNSNATVIMLADSSILPLDIAVFASATAARPGFITLHSITVRNLSAKLTGDVQVVLTHDPAVNFLNATPAPTSMAGNTITWELPQLTAFAEIGIAVQYNVPVPTSLGTVLSSSVSASCALVESGLANNVASIQQVVTGSYDPNDKLARTSSGWSDELFIIDQDEWVDYTIRFQNTGTDTAFTVVITDTLAAELDMSSFQQGTASHAFEVVFKPGRVVEWTFPNILLPDSNVNEPLSHGLVQFRIRPVQPVLPGTILENIANIYFDFNEPIITEPSVLVAEFSTGVGEAADDRPNVHPNPTSDQVWITVPSGATRTYRVFGADGRDVQPPGVWSKDLLLLDAAHLAPGCYVIHLGKHTARFLKH
jgi:uncharacterized repeat protein (TIGR01451 family)